MFEEFIRKLKSKEKFITLETTPNRSASLQQLVEKIEKSGVVEKIDGFSTTDSPLAKMKYSSLFSAVKIQNRFQKPVLATVSMRDKNKIALQSDLLGANDFDVRTILALTGDSAKISDQPNTTGVFEGDSTLLLDIVNCFNTGIDFAGKPFAEEEKPKEIYPFTVVNSSARNSKTLLKKMVKKIEHSTVGIISQPIFNREQAQNLLQIFESAKEKCGCPNPTAQLVFGLFPLTRFRTAQFLASHVPGINVPQNWLDSLRIASQNSEEEEYRVGMDMSRELYRDILEIHPKIHMMTANRFEVAKEVLR
jgi:5,10-methylenetetrahydrofolate reductase